VSEEFSKELAEQQLKSLYRTGLDSVYPKIEGTPVHPSDPMVTNVKQQTEVFEKFWRDIYESKI